MKSMLLAVILAVLGLSAAPTFAQSTHPTPSYMMNHAPRKWAGKPSSIAHHPLPTPTPYRAIRPVARPTPTPTIFDQVLRDLEREDRLKAEKESAEIEKQRLKETFNLFKADADKKEVARDFSRGCGGFGPLYKKRADEIWLAVQRGEITWEEIPTSEEEMIALFKRSWAAQKKSE